MPPTNNSSEAEAETRSGAITPVNDNELEEAKENLDTSNSQNEKIDAGEGYRSALSEKKASDYTLVSVLCLLVAFGGFVFGWDTGTISGFVNMSDFKRRFGSRESDGTYYFSNARTGLIVSIFNIGCAIGGITLGKTGDMYGRKNGLMITMVVYMIGIIIQIASINKWYQYFIGRIISGLAVGAVSVLSPMFISETSPRQIRGALVSCYQLMITLGIFLGYCTDYGTKSYTNSVQWRVPLGLCFAWAILMIIGMLFMPESPRYLIKKGRLDDARASLAKVNGVPFDDPAIFSEVEELDAAVQYETSLGKATWSELITGKPKIGFRVITGIILQSLQQLTGDNYFFYYGTTIFDAVGLSDSFETSIVLGVINFASTFVALWTVEHFGRRKVLLFGSAAQVACFVVFASVGVTRLYPNGYDGTTSEGAGNCMIVFACFFIFFFATSWAPGIFVVVSEIYPLRIRSKAMSIAQAANWIWGFLISFFTPFITSAIHFAYGYVFMGCLVFSFFFVYATVPETKGLSLEEVDEMYRAGVIPWKSSSWVPSKKLTQEGAYHKAQTQSVENAAETNESGEQATPTTTDNVQEV
ncbi:hypothetical protein PACTADRAFT_48593 [Pachysolen tannophilus NRRL Y-2460]|uniref:Major facilitator superfamily (MFS) profile domain-containing protein n=1 Tax=Pachysolen tannophilus NRRL Y-2460 TaxID=669874 RepID=A0A1E4TYF4_PACTA|nr:hypothetical protein PACTADRAFT_48593 [Pachysolen tannophilus NRRL Y-2460]